MSMRTPAKQHATPGRVGLSSRRTGKHTLGSARRRALGDISNSQRSSRVGGGKAGHKTKLAFPVLVVAPESRKAAVDTEVEDPLEVECIITGPRVQTPPPADCDVDVESVIRRVHRAALDDLRPHGDVEKITRLPDKLVLDEELEPMIFSDDDSGLGLPDMNDLIHDPELVGLGGLDDSITIHVMPLSDDDDDEFDMDVESSHGAGEDDDNDSRILGAVEDW